MADVLLPLAVKLLWDESLPLRKLVYSKLPFAKDASKRKLAEEELGKLLEDSHKLARSLTPAQADEAIDKRITLFRQDLTKGHIPPDQAETLVVRGEMFVRMLVTEPILEAAALKIRLGELEKAFASLESKLEFQAKEIENLRVEARTRKKDPQTYALWSAVVVLLILEIVQLVLTAVHASGGTH